MVEVLNRQELDDRRAQLLAEFGGSEGELRERAEGYSLTPRELAIFDELEALDYVAGAA